MPRKIIIGLCLFLSAPLPLTAQKVFEEGYIVLNSGDTLYGAVHDRKTSFTGDVIRNRIHFKNEKGRKRKYARSSIKGYRAGNRVYQRFYLEAVPQINFFNNYYQIVPFGGEEEFLRVLKEGPLSMYEMEWTDDMSEEIETFPLFRRQNEDIMVRATQGILGLKRKLLASYFVECPALQEQLMQGVFKLPQEIVTFYNSQCH